MSYDDYPAASGSYGSYSGGESALSSVLEDDGRPRILLMGTRRSGKSSIQKVVFHKMSPHETLFLESTNEIRVRDINTSDLVQFQLLDFPGAFDFSDRSRHAAAASGAGGALTPERLFKAAGALVFVIDAQDDENQFSESIDYFLTLAKLAVRVKPGLSFEVLIHKVDGDAYLSDEHKAECQNDIKKALAEELADAGLGNLRPNFHLTSIYDHSIFEAFSKIVQGLIPQLPLLERLLDGLIGSCAMDKSFLFDVVSKIYVATDSNPVDMQTYELASDMIDVVLDVSCIYGLRPRDAEREAQDGEQGAHAAEEESEKDKALAESMGVDDDSASVIRLSNNCVLYLRAVGRSLALVCLMRQDAWQNSGLVEYNLACFKDAIAKLFLVRDKQNKLRAEAAAKRMHAQAQAAGGTAAGGATGSAGGVGGVTLAPAPLAK